MAGARSWRNWQNSLRPNHRREEGQRLFAGNKVPTTALSTTVLKMSAEREIPGHRWRKWDGCVCGWSQGSRGRCRPSPLHEKRGMFHRRLGQIRLNTTLTHCRACHRDPNHLAAFDRPALFRPWSFPDTKQWHRARRTWLPRMPNVGFPQFLVETAQSSVDGSRIARENLSFRRLGRVQSSVRPVDAANERLLALMGSANKVPIWLSGYYASD